MPETKDTRRGSLTAFEIYERITDAQNLLINIDPQERGTGYVNEVVRVALRASQYLNEVLLDRPRHVSDQDLRGAPPPRIHLDGEQESEVSNA